MSTEEGKVTCLIPSFLWIDCFMLYEIFVHKVTPLFIQHTTCLSHVRLLPKLSLEFA